VADLPVCVYWRHFLGICGIFSDRTFAIRPPSILPTHLDIVANFCRDFENNAAIEVSEFFCVG